MHNGARVLLAALALAACAGAATRSLAGFWDFRYDPDDKGEAAGWSASETPAGWSRIQIPGSYDQGLRNNVLYQGKAWHRTWFEAAPGRGERALLRFDGAAIRTRVWVNGKLAGEHLFPYTGFTFDVTPLLRPGRNLLVVLTDNQLLKDAIPDTSCTGWWNYGGINRGVWLDMVPEVHLKDFSVTTRMTSDAWEFRLGATAVNAGPPAQAMVTATLADALGQTVWDARWPAILSAGDTRIAQGGSVRDVAPWSPESPTLYTLTVTLTAGSSTEQQSVSTGFRQIEVQGSRILLNGRPVVFKGVNYHEMYPGAGMTLTREQVRRDLLDMKAMGSNFVRLAHYPHDRQTYELADELGLMVWSEIPAWQTRPEALGSDAVWQTYGAPQIAEMIAQRRMYPSVVVWSVGNEFPSDRELVERYVARATALVRELDPTRLVTFASDRRERDLAFAHVDFIAINEYFGWYYGAVQDLAANLDLIHRKWPDKPVVVSEFGAEGVPGWTNPAPADRGMDYSEDYQIKLIATHLGYVLDPARSGYMAGALLWVYADFPNPSAFQRQAAHPPIAAYMNLKGLVTDDRRHKRVWDVVWNAFR